MNKSLSMFLGMVGIVSGSLGALPAHGDAAAITANSTTKVNGTVVGTSGTATFDEYLTTGGAEEDITAGAGVTQASLQQVYCKSALGVVTSVSVGSVGAFNIASCATGSTPIQSVGILTVD